MPKHDDAPALAVCDGCGIEKADVADEPNAQGHRYCAACLARQDDDPVVTVHGRALHYSELKRQAEAGDVDLAAALDGDTVQEQVKRGHADATARKRAD